MAKQDDLTRRRRLNDGRCPTHGTALCQIGHNDDGPIVECPRKTCDFTYTVKPGSKTWRAMGGDGPSVYVVAHATDPNMWLALGDVRWTGNLGMAVTYTDEEDAHVAAEAWGGNPEVMSERVYAQLCTEYRF